MSAVKPYVHLQPPPGIYAPFDMDREMKVLREHGSDRGISPGWASLAELWRLRKGEWTLVTGIPGHGKSSLIDNVIISTLASSHRWAWAVFSAENMPIARHLSGLCEIHQGKPFDRGPTERMTEDDLTRAKLDMDRHMFFLDPPDEARTIDGLLELCDWLIEHEYLDGIVIDPWNELDHKRPPAMTETEYISQSLTKIRTFARQRDVHVVIVAHPAKLQKGADGNYPVPTPYDVSGSAHWKNKADFAICVWRDEQANRDECEVYVQKVRFRDAGKLGSCRLGYDRVTGRFVEREHVPF